MLKCFWVIIMNYDFYITGISRIIYVGKYEYDEVTTSFETELKSNELIFHFSGDATVFFNDKTLTTCENTIRYLPKGRPEKYIVERRKQGDCILVCFDTNTTVSAEAFTMTVQNSVAVKNLFKKIFSVWVSRNDGYYFECISILYKIFAELQKQNYIPENQYKNITPAIEYIEENFLKEKISIEFLAQKCEISSSYLKKLFIKKFGISPVKYIIQLKINHACDLLQSELYTITQIAEICGYDNIYYFSRQFKEYVGITPTEFLNKYKSSK